MKRMGRFPAIAFTILFAAPMALAAYGTPQYDQAEPSTTYDLDHMFNETHALAGNHVYLNGFPTIYGVGPSPTLTRADGTTPPQLLYFNALMGIWRDCNRDGFIGSAVLGSEVYPVSVGYDETVCPPGAGPAQDADYVNAAGDGFVNEFLWIGPDYYPDGTKEPGETPLYGDTSLIGPSFEERNDPRNLHDPDARVWADFGLPGGTPTANPVLFPFPKGSLMTWERNLALVDEYLGVGQILHPHGVSYDTLLDVGRALDEAHVPTPLGLVKNLYNNSAEPEGGQPNCGGANETGAQPDCEGAYAQPFLVIWDCENAAEGTSLGPVTIPATGKQETVYVAPPVRLGEPNLDGSWGGTYYQLNRGLGYGDHDGDGTAECNDAAHGGVAGRVYGYWNLERTSNGGTEVEKKKSTDVSFYFYPKSRFYEVPENDARRGSSGDVTVPYTGLIDGADRHAGTGYGSFYFRGWKASNYHVFLPNGAHPLGALGEFHGASTYTFYGYSSLGEGEFPTFGQYGEEHCYDSTGAVAFGPGIQGDGTWECDPDHADWRNFQAANPSWNVVVGQTFNVRDVDCYDNTFGGITTPRAAGGTDCTTLGLQAS